MTDLSELIEKLEKATGPDRELDLSISLLAGKHGTTAQHRDMRAFFERTGRMAAERSLRWLPHYTSSLDAAMTLESDAVERVVLLMSVAIMCRKDALDPLRHGARLFCIRALRRKDGGNNG